MTTQLSQLASRNAAAPARARNTRINKVAGIDGLRGLAVLSVLDYHFFSWWIPGGFLGVDIFFVLSGFLITSLLVRELSATGRINFAKFWQRRAKRILPAAVATLVMFTALAGLAGGDPAVGIGTQFLGTLFFVNNWTQIAGSQSYFADSGIQIFAHFWSLAVEEQFYVLWPLLVAVLVGIIKRAWGPALAAISLLLALASAAWMFVSYDPQADPTRVYYGTDTHAFGLLIGAFLAFAITSRDPYASNSFPAPRWLKEVVGVVGLAALCVVVYLLLTLPATAAETYRGGLLAASISTMFVLWSVITERGVVARLFRWRMLRWCGDRSFSLYLVHWPLLVLVRELLMSNGLSTQSADIDRLIPGVIAAVLSFPLAAWSYTYIENPFRRLGYVGVWKSWLREFASANPAALARHTATVGVAIIAVLGIATAPAKSALESDLDRLAAEFVPPEHIEAVAAPLPAPEIRELPTGDQITAIGDSVMLASIQSLTAHYPGIYVDAAVSRHYTAAIPLLQDMNDRGTLDPFVVLGFGTNGPAFPGQLDEIMQAIGPDRVVIMTVPFGDRAWMPQARHDILDIATRYDNVYIADWCAVAAANPALLRSDAIHPTLEGADAYQATIDAALTQWVNRDRVIATACSA